MGIKDFLKYLKLDSLLENPKEYKYIYIDCNYLIHFLIYKCKTDADLYHKIFNFWNDLTTSIIIKNEIFLIFDGEYDGEILLNPKYQTIILRHKIISNDYDKQIIKPGSNILQTFKYYLTDIIEKYKKINKLKFKITINGDDIKGEADIKILNYIYDLSQDNICICSKDSDMILIAHSLCVNKSIKIDILTNIRSMQFINVNNFNKYGLDYVLIVLLLGNDYLPKISNVSYDSIITTYNKYIKCNESIIKNGIIEHKNLIEFITMLILLSKKKIKFNFNNLNYNRFDIYINNLYWCLKYYKVIDNNNTYIPELKNHDDPVKIKNVINIFNFINYNYLKIHN